jgi:hypothetical protein
MLRDQNGIKRGPKSNDLMSPARWIQNKYILTYDLRIDGWKGLTFIGKSNGILTNATRKHSDALSVIEYLSLPKEDLLAYEFRTGEVFRPSYFIARDRATNSIVLSIRGTMVS